MSRDGERGLFYQSNTEIILQVQKEDRSMRLGQGGMREASRSRSPDTLRQGPSAWLALNSGGRRGSRNSQTFRIPSKGAWTPNAT